MPPTSQPNAYFTPDALFSSPAIAANGGPVPLSLPQAINRSWHAIHPAQDFAAAHAGHAGPHLSRLSRRSERRRRTDGAEDIGAKSWVSHGASIAGQNHSMEQELELVRFQPWGNVIPAMGWDAKGRAWKPLCEGLWIRDFETPDRDMDEPLED